MAGKNSDGVKETLVTCETSQGAEIHATLLRLTRYLAVFETHDPHTVFRTSEALGDFKIRFHNRTVYSGRAIVTSILTTGTAVLCETKLDETGFLVASISPTNPPTLRAGFEQFLGEWQKLYKVLPEFKVVVADMQTFLTDLRLWLEQVELEIRATPEGSRIDKERQALEELGGVIVPAFDSLHERLEELSEKVEEDLRPAHQAFAKRLLHSIVMCSPFAYRTYHKPLGYAGDYEMVNMIVRDPYEGGSLFAKAMNVWFLQQWPAKAHRNRIAFLEETLRAAGVQGVSHGERVRIWNLGCGPAVEVQRFLAGENLSENTQFTLLDFNEETVEHTSRTLDDIKRRYGRRTPIEIQRKSVQHVLKEAAKPSMDVRGRSQDLIYCAGLFDYLSDRTCKQLMNIFYELLAPGGRIVATNVDDCKPFRNMLEFVLDWHLLYRDEKRALSLAPDRAPAGATTVKRDVTGVNLFIEVKKPEYA